MVLHKLRSQHQLVPGYWGSPWRTTQLRQVSEHVRVLLQDKMLMRGRPVDLWLPVDATTPDVVACTCRKDTTDQSDRSCLTCFGSGFAPGVLKFLHQTLFWCSAEASSFTLTDVSVSTLKKSNVLVLNNGELTGSIVTQDKAFTNPNSLDYALKIELYRRAPGTTFVLEFSTDAGTSWTPVTLTEVASPGFGFIGTIAGADLPGTGSVRFRITMTRASLNDLPPAFEILRIRRVLSENVNPQIVRRRPDYSPGNILALFTHVNEGDSLEVSRGLLTEHQAARSWTNPLDYFDITLTRETPPCRIKDLDAGPHPFIGYVSGVQGGDRYILTRMQYNEQFVTVFTHQLFDERRAIGSATAPGEPTWLVW